MDPLSGQPASPPPEPLRLAVLGSGSRGNSAVLEAPEGALLLDVGFSCRELERRLGLLGVEPSRLLGVVVTHEHGDHVRGLSRLCRRHDLPFWATPGTLEALDLPEELRRSARVLGSEGVEIGPFRVESFAIPHDAREPVGFVVADTAGRRVGLAADMGCRSQLAWARLRELGLLLLETNHDLEMLRQGPYPWPLKQRIAGRHGHLSNREALEGLEELVDGGLGGIVAYHLSRTNNSAALVEALLCERLAALGSSIAVTVADQDVSTSWMTVDKVG